LLLMVRPRLGWVQCARWVGAGAGLDLRC